MRDLIIYFVTILTFCNSLVRIKKFLISTTFLKGGLNLNEIYTSSDGTFNSAITLFDYANSLDPNQDQDENGNLCPRELLYSRRLYDMVMYLTLNKASLPLKLAARSQHIVRWKIPRTSYLTDKNGYLTWRASLKKFHATTSCQILLQVGFEKNIIDTVEELILKKNFPKDSDARTLEDALCLVFLKYQLAAFAEKTEDDKTVNALRKSWGKMSEQGRAEALKLNYDSHSSELINRALSGK